MENADYKPKKTKKIKDPFKKKKIACIATLVVGIIALVVGAVFLVLSLNRGASVADGEYLVAADSWALTDCGENDCDKVVWDFTEIGRGSLTTDGGEHNYDFIWAIEDGRLLIETDWLYEMENEYEYSLDQGNGVLTLKAGDSEYQFTAQ